MNNYKLPEMETSRGREREDEQNNKIRMNEEIERMVEERKQEMTQMEEI